MTTTSTIMKVKPLFNSIEKLREDSGKIPEVLGDQIPFIILVEYEKYKQYALSYRSPKTEINSELSLTHFSAKVICKYY